MPRRLNKVEKDWDQVGQTILMLVLLAWFLTEVITWDRNSFYFSNYHGWIIGFGGWAICQFYAQKIIDQNRFISSIGIASSAFGLLWLKQALTTYAFTSLYLSVFPVLYLILLRVLLNGFFPTYPAIRPTPRIILPSKYNAYWKGKEQGYKPKVRERVFSGVLFLGSLLILLGGLVMVKHLQN